MMGYIILVLSLALAAMSAACLHLYRARNKFRARAKRVKRISYRRRKGLGPAGRQDPAQKRVDLLPTFDAKRSPLASLVKPLEKTRLPEQDVVPLILPPLDVDLATFRSAQYQNQAASGRPRKNIHLHAEKLAYSFSGQSGLIYLNALCISYLRRDTPHTDHAKQLFHRIWREESETLLSQISMRWLISTLQTFLDHAENSQQQIIGASGYFYGNMVKIYEGERTLFGIQDKVFFPKQLGARMPESLSEMEGYLACRADIFVNMNTMAFEIAQGDPVAGPVLLKLLERVQGAETIFTRVDRTNVKREQRLVEKFNRLFWCWGVDARQNPNSPVYAEFADFPEKEAG